MDQAKTLKKGLDPPILRATIHLSLSESHWSSIFNAKYLHSLSLTSIPAYSVLSFPLSLTMLIYSYRENIIKYTFHNQVKMCDTPQSSQYS